ncbi:AKAP7-RIRII-bdg domain-containing protein [Aix galericulata]|nr:AKAP7-RIRII-bdg domain-containing protein [Aix galericulata]
MVFAPGEKPGPEQDEVKLQNASKQIVQTAILQAVQQVSQESQQKEKRTNSSMSLQLERGKLTKKHEKKALELPSQMKVFAIATAYDSCRVLKWPRRKMH